MKKIKNDRATKPLSYSKINPDNSFKRDVAAFNQPKSRPLGEDDKRFWKWAFMRLNKEYCRDFKRYKAQENELLKTLPKKGVEREIKHAEFIWRVSTLFRTKHGIYKPLDPKNEKPFEWNFYSSVPAYLFLPDDNLPRVIRRIAELESDTPSVDKMVPTIVGIYANLDYPKTRVIQRLEQAVDLLYRERREAKIDYKADKRMAGTYKKYLLWWNRYQEFISDPANFVGKTKRGDKNHVLKMIRHYDESFRDIGLPHFESKVHLSEQKKLKNLQDEVERCLKRTRQLIKGGYREMEPAATSSK